MEEGCDADPAAYLDRFDALTPYEIRCPHHAQSVARDIIESGRLCPPEDHEWIDLDGYYWHVCRRCNIADVTAAAIGQPVATPHTDRKTNAEAGG